MRLIQRTRIERPAARVWKYVIKPEYFQKWNKKVESMEARDEFSLGQFFMTRYAWHKKQSQCKSVATSIIEGRLLELRHSDFVGMNIKHDMIVIERVILEERKDRTLVTKEVSMKNHTIPFLVVPIFWLVNRFGWSKEPDALKFLCESENE